LNWLLEVEFEGKFKAQKQKVKGFYLGPWELQFGRHRYLWINVPKETGTVTAYIGKHSWSVTKQYNFFCRRPVEVEKEQGLCGQ
jgi:hypothetical protein